MTCRVAAPAPRQAALPRALHGQYTWHRVAMQQVDSSSRSSAAHALLEGGCHRGVTWPPQVVTPCGRWSSSCSCARRRGAHHHTRGHNLLLAPQEVLLAPVSAGHTSSTDLLRASTTHFVHHSTSKMSPALEDQPQPFRVYKSPAGERAFLAFRKKVRSVHRRLPPPPPRMQVVAAADWLPRTRGREGTSWGAQQPCTLLPCFTLPHARPDRPVHAP